MVRCDAKACVSSWKPIGLLSAEETVDLSNVWDRSERNPCDAIHHVFLHCYNINFKTLRCSVIHVTVTISMTVEKIKIGKRIAERSKSKRSEAKYNRRWVY